MMVSDVCTLLLLRFQTIKDLSHNRMEVKTGASVIRLKEDAWCTQASSFTLYDNKQWLEGTVQLPEVVGRTEKKKYHNNSQITLQLVKCVSVSKNLTKRAKINLHGNLYHKISHFHQSNFYATGTRISWAKITKWSNFNALFYLCTMGPWY